MQVFELANAWRKTMGLPVLDPFSKENPWANNAASDSDSSDEESSSEVYEESSKIVFKEDGSVDVLDKVGAAAPEQPSEDDTECVVVAENAHSCICFYYKLWIIIVT